jgi:hypothetical protein
VPGAPGGGFPDGPGGPGGLLGSPTPSAELTALLEQDAGSYTWAAAAIGSNSAAGYQLATGSPVMAVGGFNGTDPAPSLEQFQALVAAKKIHYFVGGGTGGRGPGARGAADGSSASGGVDQTAGGSGGSNDAARIATWVQQHYPATTVGGATVYDLSGATTAGATQ